MADAIPLDWLPAVRMDRIVLHWTGGTHKANALDKKHYHFIIEGDGKVVRGNRSIADNVPPLRTYAAHTRGCNSYAIGISLACMGGEDVRESPFVAGKWPMTRKQFDAMAVLAALLCKRYQIPVTPKTVLWHSEVQGTLGIQQAGKWDATRLAFDLKTVGAKACGDRIRADIEAVMSGKRPVAPTPTVNPTTPIAAPKTPAGGIVDTPLPETAGNVESGSSGLLRALGWILGLAVAGGLTYGAVHYRVWELFS